MKKKGIIIIGILIIGLAILLDSIAPAKFDWQKSYHESKKQPFDLTVFYDHLDTLFYDFEIETLKETFYEHQNRIFTTRNTTNNIYINIDERFEPDLASENKLLSFIASGNTAFISAHHFSASLLDSLHVLKQAKQSSFVLLDSLKLSLKHHQSSLAYIPKLKYFQTYFKDSSNINSLGYVGFNENDSISKKETNFIKISHGFGVFYLHTQPEIFTNYELLKAENTDYINHLISTIPEEPILKKELSKDDKDLFVFNETILSKKQIYFQSNYFANQELVNSPLRFIKANKELNLAWMLVLIGIGLFLIINSKRKQRIVPIIPKVRNTSLEFIETIATLYEEADNFQPIVQQKIHIFYKYIRKRYNIVTDSTNTKLAHQLSKKSGYDFDKAKELIRFINTIKNRETSSMTLLTKLNIEIENFYKNTNAWKN